MNKILVTGGTGVLGTAVIKELQKQQQDFISISRKPTKEDSYDASVAKYPASTCWKRADLLSGEGLPGALSCVKTVLHLASSMETIGKEPAEVVAARNLLEASSKAGVEHLIYISIVGIDRIPFPYYKAKLQVEEMIMKSGIPYTILRATQFHNFIDFQISKLMRLPVGLIPKRLKFQPIQVEVVARELVTLSQSKAQNQLLNIGGRQILELGEMVEIWQCKQGKHKPVLGIPALGSVMQAFAKGYATCSETASDASVWAEYVSSKYSPVSRQNQAVAVHWQ